MTYTELIVYILARKWTDVSAENMAGDIRTAQKMITEIPELEITPEGVQLIYNHIRQHPFKKLTP